jgi:hypothetical protein
LDRELVADLKVDLKVRPVKVAWVVNQSQPSSSQEPSHRTVGTCPTHRTEKEKRTVLRVTIESTCSIKGTSSLTKYTRRTSRVVTENRKRKLPREDQTWCHGKSIVVLSTQEQKSVGTESRKFYHGRTDVVSRKEHRGLIKHTKERRD